MHFEEQPVTSIAMQSAMTVTRAHDMDESLAFT
jgi:hypothetical protein